MPERKIDYESLAHQSDAGFKVKAPSLQRLFIDSALALTDVMVKLDRIADGDRKPISVTADDKENLMVAWLNEILTLFEKQKFLCKRVVFNHFDGKKIEATVFGENYQPLKHGAFGALQKISRHQVELGISPDTSDPESLFYARVFLHV